MEITGTRGVLHRQQPRRGDRVHLQTSTTTPSRRELGLVHAEFGLDHGHPKWLS